MACELLEQDKSQLSTTIPPTLMSDEPRKSKAQRRVERLTERQRTLDAEMLAAKLELKLQDEIEKEQQGAVAFVACVRRLDRGRLDSLRATVFGGSDANEAQIGLVKDWFDTLITTPSTQAATTLSDTPPSTLLPTILLR